MFKIEPVLAVVLALGIAHAVLARGGLAVAGRSGCPGAWSAPLAAALAGLALPYL